MSFSELGLSEKVLQAVTASGYTEPTPIQAQAIPHVLARRDVLGIAQTGTGKTAAFTLPMLTLLETGRARARMPRTLILEPTRELAAQVEESFDRYGVNHRLSVALLIGGVSFGDQDTKIMRGVDVLIATPGRLLDHFERGKLLLTGVELLVIDEADRMLDMGFIPDIERIVKLVPFTRQTLFFSATMPPEITRLASEFLHNPVRIEVARPATAAETIIQRLIAVGSEPHEKRERLRDLIRNEPDFKNAIIFCNRKRDVAVLHRSLQRHSFNAAALHGDLDQRARMAALDSFRTGEVPLLVASDVAARGLDIPAVSHVLNFDVPHHAEDYVHRIGRTGRAGRSGHAYTLVSPEDTKSLGAIEKLIGGPIPWEGGDLSGIEPSRSEGRRRGSERPRRGGGGRGGSDESADRGSRRRRGGSRVAEEGRAPRTEQDPSEERPEAREAKPARPRREGQQEARPPRSRSAEPRPARSPAEEPQEAGSARSPRSEEPQETRGPERSRTDQARESRPARSRSDEPRARRPAPPRDADDGGPAGLGDHVPAFLLRPTFKK